MVCVVVCCRVVWCGVVRCGVVWCGVLLCVKSCCVVLWCGVVWCGAVWCGAVWCGAVWCGVVPSLYHAHSNMDLEHDGGKKQNLGSSSPLVPPSSLDSVGVSVCSLFQPDLEVLVRAFQVMTL